MVCHCLLIETDKDGLILVDSGFGTADCADPKRIHFSLRLFGSPRLKMAETALSQIEALGFTAKDVRHIVLTHLDLDHAGGISDFPHARIHVHQLEYEAAFSPKTLTEKRRYLPAHWAHQPNWQTYSAYGDDWFGFKSLRKLEGIDAEVALIPLVGHTRGHSGIAIGTQEKWMLHAGDAYFFHKQLDQKPSCPKGLNLFQQFAAVNNKDRVINVERLRDVRQQHAESVQIISAHDPVEYNALQIKE